MTSRCILVANGSPLESDVPAAAIFLRRHPGAYTTSRTQNDASSIIFWDRHLLRIVNSANLLLRTSPHLFGSAKEASISVSQIRSLAASSFRQGFPVALKKRNRAEKEEVAVTVLISGNHAASHGFDFYLHIGFYVPPLFGIKGLGARLAVVGEGRGLAAAKYTEWVKRREELEKLRPSYATDLLLSNDVGGFLEGAVANFFVVCRREANAALDILSHSNSWYPFEVQTAPVGDVLPGVIRQLIIEICLLKRIPFREVAPSWSNRELWEEAFITNSLKLVQHVELIQSPISLEGLHLKRWQDVSWEEKHFEGPGFITEEIQKEVMKRAELQGYPLECFL